MRLRIATWNVNSVRLRVDHLARFATEHAPDVVCLQEIKATKEDVDLAAIERLGFETYWFPAQKKGYSGVAVFTKVHPDHVAYGTGDPQSDNEGRVLRLDLGDRTLINAYFPSGTTGEVRQLAA